MFLHKMYQGKLPCTPLMLQTLLRDRNYICKHTQVISLLLYSYQQLC